jgi:hypothetical protein
VVAVSLLLLFHCCCCCCCREYAEEDRLPEATEDEVLMGRILGHDRWGAGGRTAPDGTVTDLCSDCCSAGDMMHTAG